MIDKAWLLPSSVLPWMRNRRQDYGQSATAHGPLRRDAAGARGLLVHVRGQTARGLRLRALAPGALGDLRRPGRADHRKSTEDSCLSPEPGPLAPRAIRIACVIFRDD